MTNWWVAQAWEISPVLLFSWVFWVIASIVLHELAHGWAAIWCGDRTPIETGHMTINPMVHMGPMSLAVFALVGIAWGLMPVDPSRFRRPHQDALVAAAGPLMNLILAAICLVLLCLWVATAGGYWAPGLKVPDHVFRNFQMFFHTGAMLNIVLMLFNLIPIPPLDGSRIVASFSSGFARLWADERSHLVALLAFIFVFFFAGDVLFGAAATTVRTVSHAVLRVIAPGAI